ncbi:hypothetical protein NU219Hw_g7687t1 [Hortaea werneckii]
MPSTMYKLLLQALFAASALALPVEERAAPAQIEERAAAPSATIKNGTVIGSTTNRIDSFSGIPFALPPTGTLRLKPPQSRTSAFPGGTFTATAPAKACPQFAFQVDGTDLPNDIPSDVLGELLNTPLFQEVLNQDEDCLQINVQRPAGTSKDAKLPVLFWIYGGGFEAGWASMYDGSKIIQKSVDLGQPIMYVSVGYRLGGFGFLAGDDLAKEGSTNLGLRDQRLGLQWVQDNIAGFGGDPEKVTIWGESAGAISVMDHTIINGGDNTYNGKPLFRGAIMNSGSIVPANTVTTPKAQTVYDTVVSAAGCSGSDDKLACLRAAPYQTFLRAANSVPGILGYRAVDLSYLPRPDPGDNFFSLSPEVSVQNGQIAKVPVIVGDQKDEGTLFSLFQNNITTNNQLIDYLASYFPENPNARADVAGLVAQYPNQPLLGQPAGSPFDTGSFNNIYPQFKRLAAILGDITFTLTRRYYLDLITSQGIQAWSYLAQYLQGTPILGTFHASDILFADYGTLGQNIPFITTQTYYISFVNNLNPNAISTAAPLINWPQWTNSSGNPQLLNLRALRNTLIPDNFRSGAYNYLSQTVGGGALRT